MFCERLLERGTAAGWVVNAAGGLLATCAREAGARVPRTGAKSGCERRMDVVQARLVYFGTRHANAPGDWVCERAGGKCSWCVPIGW